MYILLNQDYCSTASWKCCFAECGLAEGYRILGETTILLVCNFNHCNFNFLVYI